MTSEVGGWASVRRRLLLMFEVDRHEDEIRKVRPRCYRRKVRSWAFKLELSFLLSDVVSQSWKLNRIFRHCVVWRWKSMYTRIDVATRSWMLFANIECWHTTLIFGGDCTPYSVGPQRMTNTRASAILLLCWRKMPPFNRFPVKGRIFNPTLLTTITTRGVQFPQSLPFVYVVCQRASSIQSAVLSRRTRMRLKVWQFFRAWLSTDVMSHANRQRQGNLPK